MKPLNHYTDLIDKHTRTIGASIDDHDHVISSHVAHDLIEQLYADATAYCGKKLKDLEDAEEYIDQQARVISMLEGASSSFPFSLSDLFSDEDRAFYRRFNGEDDEEDEDE